MFNTGVLAYRKTTLISTLFDEWERLHTFHMELASEIPPASAPYISADLDDIDRKFLLCTDQLSLARILSPVCNEYGVKVKILDDVWNARGYPPSELGRVIVDHASRHKIRPEDVGAFLAARSMSPREVAQ
jgi:hypothetical protein